MVHKHTQSLHQSQDILRTHISPPSLSPSVEPAHVFTFINQFIRLLQLYLPSLSPSSIQAHFALVLQLIDLVCPSPGAPLSLSPASQPDLLLATLPRPTPVLANFLAQAADSLYVSFGIENLSWFDRLFLLTSLTECITDIGFFIQKADD